MKAVLHARESSPEPIDPPDNTNEPPDVEGDWESIKPAPIDPPDNSSLPGDPSVTRPDY